MQKTTNCYKKRQPSMFLQQIAVAKIKNCAFFYKSCTGFSMQSAPNSSFLKHLFPAFERNMESAFYLQFGDAKAKYNKLQLISTIKINPAGCLVSSAAGFVRVIKLYRKLQLQLKKRGFARIEFLHRAAAHLAICPNGKFFLHKSKSIMIPTFQLFVKLLLSEI